MNTLHHVQFVSGALTTGLLNPAPPLVGYIDINQVMAVKFGRSMSPMAIYDLVAVRADIVLATLGVLATGAGYRVSLRYVEPGSTRIKALQEAQKQWIEEMREPDTAATAQQFARSRQFYPKYDDEMPTTPYHSLTETAGGVAEPVVMIDRAVAAGWGVFDDWNARHPTWPAATAGQDGIVPADPRLYTIPASELEAQIALRAHSTVELDNSGFILPLINDIYNGHYADAEYLQAPSGTAWPVMTGQLRVQLDEVTPPDTALQGVTTFFLALDLYVRGWRAITPIRGTLGSRRS